MVSWRRVVKKIGVPNLHFHDRRHTGNTLAADAGVSTKNLMARMGHDSERAALIYQHMTAKGDRLIADALDAQLRAEQENKVTEADDDDQGEGTPLSPCLAVWLLHAPNGGRITPRVLMRSAGTLLGVDDDRERCPACSRHRSGRRMFDRRTLCPRDIAHRSR